MGGGWRDGGRDHIYIHICIYIYIHTNTYISTFLDVDEALAIHGLHLKVYTWRKNNSTWDRTGRCIEHYPLVIQHCLGKWTT